MKEAYCLWFDKFIRDLYEHETETCLNEICDYCDACDFFAFKELPEFEPVE